MKSSLWVHLCFRGHTDCQSGHYISFAHNTNFQFPLLNLSQAATAMQPQMLLRSPSDAFTSRQNLCFIKHLGAGVLVSVHSPTLPAHPSQRPERENSQTAPWESIFEFHLGLLCTVSNLSSLIVGGWASSWVKGRQTQPHQRGQQV